MLIMIDFLGSLVYYLVRGDFVSLFTERLNIIVKEAGITWTELARRTGMSTGRISQYKTGIYTPKSDALFAIAEAMNVSPDWLAGVSDSKVCYPSYRYLQDLTPFDMRLLNMFHSSDERIKQAVCALLNIDTRGISVKQTRLFTDKEINES